jgi:kelch-like protein 10
MSIDKVYIAGGFNGQECLNTAECYDPITRQWTMIAPMRNRRSGIGVIAHDGFVYAIGGFNGITRMNNGEKFNPSTNSWSNITEMYSPRSNFGIEVGTRITEQMCCQRRNAGTLI